MRLFGNTRSFPLIWRAHHGMPWLYGKSMEANLPQSSPWHTVPIVDRSSAVLIALTRPAGTVDRTPLDRAPFRPNTSRDVLKRVEFML
jgi:hypothetical protein